MNTNQKSNIGVRALAIHVLVVGLALGTGCGPSQPASDNLTGHDHAAHDRGPEPAPAAEAKCPHDAPKKFCFICDASLRDKGRLWCKEHSLYEDECFLCDPSRKPDAPQAAAPVLMCKEHGMPEAECGICRPDAVGQLKPGETLKVRLPSDDSARLAGIATAPAGTGPMADGIACYAEVEFDQNRYAEIAAPAGGIIQEVVADLGAKVEENQVVARIWSAAIAETVAKAVLTHQTLERERKLHAEGIAPAKDLQAAEAEHRAACQQARTLGFSEADIDAFGARPDDSVLLEVRAPFAGEIVARNAVRGSLIEPGTALFTVADRSTMWATLHVPETALPRLQVGQSVELDVDSLPGRVFTGKLTWVSAEVDEKSRLARARAEFANPGGLLRAKMFARARVLVRAADDAVVVPPAAIQQVEANPIVFVKLADDLYEVRPVQLGARRESQVEVVNGLKRGETVVVEQGFTVKSQLLVSRLGAGCAHE
jgi:cobalt-zinc-cadmium efflux system membrane fusion protein